MRKLKNITLVILLVSFRLIIFADTPAHINISAGVQCQLWGNVVVTLAGNLNNQGTFGASGTSKTVFSGTTVPETIGGTGTTQFQNADLNNPTNFQLTGHVSVNSTLSMLSGTLNIGNFDLTIGPSGTITSPSFGTNAMIIADASKGSGQLKKIYPTGATNFTFPIGDITTTTDYSPVMLNLLTNSVQRTIGLNVTDQQNSNDLSTTNYLSRYWSFTDDGGTSAYTYNANFSYSSNAPTDLTGTYNSVCIYWWNGQWHNLPTTYPGAPIYGVNGADQITGTLGGNQFTGRPCSCDAPSFTQQPQSFAGCTPVTTNFTIETQGGEGITSYQWQSSTDGNSWNPISNGPLYSGVTSPQLNVTGATNTSQYRCMAINCLGANNVPSNAATLTVNTAPVITSITPPRLKCSRDSVMFKVAITGTTPYSIQWNPSNIVGVITVADTGKYICNVSNICGSTSASTSLSLSTPPYIEKSPESVTLCEGTTVNFTVKATGTNLDYQWTRSGNNIAGATNSSYPISKIKGSDGDVYSCIVGNICGTKSSDSFLLTVNLKPSATTQSVTLTRNVGDNTPTFSISPTGTPPFKYQWMHYSINIPGATTTTFGISSISCDDAGVYSSMITNTCGSTDVPVAKLIVNNCPKDSIKGMVTYDNVAKTPIINVTVYREDGQNHKLDSAVTDNTGTFKLFNVANGTYNIVFGKTGMKWGGSNPVDALTVNKYYVSMINAFGGDNALRKIAANVNNDTFINPLDALLINRRFLSFVKHFSISDWLYDPPSATVTVSGSLNTKNFIGICAGDVNGSYPK
jgi:hypothetical protein